MRASRSPATGRPYGVERVCRVWRVARSSFYARKHRESQPRPAPNRRGPKPSVSDDRLLQLIREDLDGSPFKGEGHRKVWARLKFGKGLRMSRKRVLRLMREHNLLSPYRRPQGFPREHDGHIITASPNVMWGTDATRIFTVDEGYVWLFAAVEHWNGECVGWHVTKKGNRLAALEPIAQGVLAQFGTIEHASARGLALRMDHGSQYTSDRFQQLIKAWGILPSFAFLKEPETNGVSERFFRTLKEQTIYGRIFENAVELRQVVGEFIERYNRQWRLEKNGYRTPYEMRENHDAKVAA